MKAAVEEAIRDGTLSGSPNIVTHLLWSGVHGIVALHLADMLRLGVDVESLVEAFIERELTETASRRRPPRAERSLQ
jgi:hypothetical protein